MAPGADIDDAPRPTAEEAAAAAAFEALMWALARPGERRRAPEPAFRSIIRAVIDLECRVYAEDPAIASLLSDVGAEPAPAAAADYAFIDLSSEAGLAAFEALPRGSALYPDRGATAFSPARFDDGPSLRLSGPGVDGARTLSIGGPPSRFWAARAALIRYPAGVDLVLVDGAEVIGLPRSAVVEAI